MTRRIGNTVYIEDEPDHTCTTCHQLCDTRPAGPNGEQICVPCAEKTPGLIDAYLDRLLGDACIIATPNAN